MKKRLALLSITALLVLAATAPAALAGWSAAGSLLAGRYGETGTLLPNGKVLVVGGYGGIDSAELYDPETNSWSAAASPATGRAYHTATLLPNGKVLVAGGTNNSTGYSSAELYDPETNSWSAAGSLSTVRIGHTATLLPNGKVLVVGGTAGGSVPLSSAELYDPETNSWSSAGSLSVGREGHTATLLTNGKVLVAGGVDSGGAPLASAELYDPVTNSWSAADSLSIAREYATATLLPNGKVLVAGGEGLTGALSSAELYDPETNSWSAAGSLSTARQLATATLLRSGKVLVVGGYYGVNSTELYDPGTNSWSSAGSLSTGRSRQTATLLPNGKVLVAAGEGSSFNALSSAELYDPATNSYDTGTNGWSSAGSLSTARDSETATLLLNGKVLVTGGYDRIYLNSAALYDPGTNSWSSAGSLTTARAYATATLLPNGKVLVAGGGTGSGILSSAELYDPGADSWSSAGSLTTARAYATATLLPEGKVLVAGGVNMNGILSSAELYDPATNSWSAAGSLSAARASQTATLLPSGEVLVAGGVDGNDNPVNSAELYDPGTNSWSAAGSLTTARAYATATLLPNGKVLVSGGYGGTSDLSSAELYDSGWGFDDAWRPVVTYTSSLVLTARLIADGSGFCGYGLTEASDGSTNNSSTGYPLVQLRSIDSGEELWLTPANFVDTMYVSSRVMNFPAGPALLTFFVNGIPSESVVTDVQKQTTTTTVALTSGTNPSAYGDPVTFTATVKSATGTPTGTVTFKDGSVVIGTATLSATVDGAGQASFTIVSLPGGNDSITVVYGGDLYNDPSTSSALSQTVNATLAVTKTGTGSGTVTADSGTISWVGNSGSATYAGTVVTLTATADTDSTFSGWLGYCDANGQVTMDADKYCVATFTLNQYSVSASAGSNGSVDASTTSPQTVDYGGTTSFKFNAATGYHVASISGCGGTAYSNSGNSVGTFTYSTGTIKGDCTVNASFAINEYKLSLGPSGSGSGSVSDSVGDISCIWDGSGATGTCSYTYDYNTNVDLTETPGKCSYFNGWSSACTGNGSECSVTMDQDGTAGADFDLYPLSCLTRGQAGYNTISGAYTNTSGGSIYIQAYAFGEDLVLDRPVDVILDSGWDCDFAAYSGNTTIDSLTVDHGSVTLKGNALVIGP